MGGPPGRSWVRNPWVWVALAIAAVGGAIALGAVLRGAPDHHPSPQAKHLRAVHKVQARAVEACPEHELVDGQVAREMGDCAPPAQKLAASKGLVPPSVPELAVPAKPTEPAGPTARAKPTARAAAAELGPDLSNNNPVYNQSAIRRHGHRYEWLKLSEGSSFVDRTAAQMAKNAKAAGIIVGGYHFAHPCLTSYAAEARLFVSRIKAIGLLGKDSLRPVLDVEYGGCSTAAGTVSWIAHLRAEVVAQIGVEVGIYSGNWWLAPHTGCLFKYLPPGVFAWISGYPNASAPCGRSGIDVHQFSDRYFNGVINGDMNRLVRASLDSLRATPPGPPPPSAHAIALCKELNVLRARKKAQGGILHEYGTARKHAIHRTFEKVKHGYRYKCPEQPADGTGVKHVAA